MRRRLDRGARAARMAPHFPTDPAMAGIDIHHPHQLPPERAREAVQQVADKLVERFGVDCRWQDEVLAFNGSGVDGRIALLPGEVHVTATLGFPVSMMQGPIESRIRQVLEERLA